MLAPGGVPVTLGEIGQHLGQHFGIHRRRGVVVEIDPRAFHCKGFFHNGRAYGGSQPAPARRRIVFAGKGERRPLRRFAMTTNPLAAALLMSLLAAAASAQEAAPETPAMEGDEADEAAQPDTRRKIRVLENP